MRGLMAVIFLLLSAVAGLAIFVPSEAASAGESRTVQDGINLSFNNLSFNNSTIYYGASSNISTEPVILAAGNGYYASHPISYSSQIGSETSIENAQAAASLQQEINYAHGINGEVELKAMESSFRAGGHFIQQSNTASMRINEDVTEGHVHIGVLQGQAGGQSDMRTSSSIMAPAWKSPSLEMEQDYFGTYHIEMNMSINMPHFSSQRLYGWLDCCGLGSEYPGYFDRLSVSSDQVFGSHFAGGR
ncbi:MAG: hypothetical protein HPY61_10325 [Methanotrichaceae archaeon]|nr:hypothetical protein [Methanotrichaceae archaeon]